MAEHVLNKHLPWLLSWLQRDPHATLPEVWTGVGLPYSSDPAVDDTVAARDGYAVPALLMAARAGAASQVSEGFVKKGLSGPQIEGKEASTRNKHKGAAIWGCCSGAGDMFKFSSVAPVPLKRLISLAYEQHQVSCRASMFF